MDTPELAKLEADAKALKITLLAFITANKAKCAQLAAIVGVPALLIAFEIGKHMR